MIPYFYQHTIDPDQKQFTLDTDTSRHCIQVLRMQAGEVILLTDGKGLKVKAEITRPDKKHCTVQSIGYEQLQLRKPQLSIGIAFTKNKARNEWFLEKATEIGTEHIYPVICHRSEKEKWNRERCISILVSAMLQSQQCFLPVLYEPVTLERFITSPEIEQRLIAHCIPASEKKSLLSSMQPGKNTLILIGPEGDFSNEEIAWAADNQFYPVSLGHNRLRTETAGIYACTVFNVLNHA